MANISNNCFLFVFSRWDIHNHTWPIAEALRPAVVNLDFQRGGATLFRATNFAGYVGIITAIKPVRKWENWKFVPTIRCNFIVMHKSYLLAKLRGHFGLLNRNSPTQDLIALALLKSCSPLKKQFSSCKLSFHCYFSFWNCTRGQLMCP